VTAALALVATSCGGDEEEPAERADTVEERSSTTQAAGDEGSAEGDDTAEDDREDDPAVVAELEELALELSDLPTGWSTMPDDDEDDGDAEEDGSDGGSDMAEDCGIEGEILPDDVEPLGEVEREFQKAEMGPFLFVSVTRFDEGEAEAAMDALGTMVQECRQFSSTDEEGVETSGSMEALSAGSFGDETFAARMNLESEGMSGQGDIVAARKGDDVVLMMGLSMTTILGSAPFGAGEYEQLVAAAATKAFG
jgi:hypothetical protein